ncbi:HYR-like domain-containing protein, partial [Hanstruepera flava]|uniref:HYR-like domain-containing protein n=1 Tax=Hanstruepera flava TaxID=2930218 RepID=UPI00202875AC
YTQTWTANVSDACGNQAEAVSVTYTWTVDTKAPVIMTDAENGDLGCNPEVMEPMFTAEDNCEVGDPIVTTEGPSNDGCAYTQTWTANVSDACGNQAEAVSVTYTWTVDTEAPVITTKNQSMDLGCNPEVIAPEFMATDNCGSIEVEVSTEGPQNPGGWDCSYSQTWTATAMDPCGNEAESVSITYTWIQDTLPPKVNCSAIEAGDLGCNPEEIPSGESLIDLIDTDDNCLGSSEVFVYDTILDDEGCDRSVTYIFSAIDSCGNETYDFERCSVTYTWTVDTEIPVITADSESGDLGCNPEIVSPMFMVSDNCMDGEIGLESETEGPSNDGCAYTQTWTANYTDACGNQAEAVSVTYTWTVDTEAPVITSDSQ